MSRRRASVPQITSPEGPPRDRRRAARRGRRRGARAPPVHVTHVAWLRQFAKLWGFALFCIFVVYFFREVALPFLFAILVAYILAPLVDRLGALEDRRPPFPRALAVIILYINIIAALSLFIGYFIPKLSGDFARLFREAPQLFSRLNKEVLPRPAPGSTRTSAPEAEARRRAMTAEADARRATPREPRARGIVLEPLPDGRFRSTCAALALEVQPTPRRALHRRGAALRGGGRPSRAASGSARSRSG